MSKEQLTPWFVNGEKPAYPGVYNVSCRNSNQTGGWWSYWSGSQWYSFSWCKEWALDYYQQSRRSARMDGGSWRGLAQKPAGFKP